MSPACYAGTAFGRRCVGFLTLLLPCNLILTHDCSVSLEQEKLEDYKRQVEELRQTVEALAQDKAALENRCASFANMRMTHNLMSRMLSVCSILALCQALALLIGIGSVSGANLSKALSRMAKFHGIPLFR